MTMLLLFILLTCSLRADYQEGLDAYQQGDYDKALGEWLEVTRSPPDQVHPGVLAETYYAIAMLFWTGQGVPQDTATAASWLQKAAEMHHAGAQTKLGYLCSSGQGVKQSDFEALKWFQMAAWQGDADAQYNLAVLYREGVGVEANQTKALEWFREAASNGDAESAKIVAQYEGGRPVAGQAAATSGTLLQGPDTTLDDDDSSGPADETAFAAQVEAAVPNPPAQVIIPVAETQVADVRASPEEAPKEGPVEMLKSTSGEIPGEIPDEKPDVMVETAASELANESAIDEFIADPPQVMLQQASWILDRDPQHYTIQVIALRNKGRLLDLTDAHPEWAPWAMYEQSHKGLPLWVLVQGDYADMELARAAVQRFPIDIQQRNQLWIRRFVMVQGLLR